MGNRFNYPYLGFGVGLRAEHYAHVLAHRPKEVDWFEIISENFMEAHAGYREFLIDLRADYPLVMHGVSLSLGSPDPLNQEYLTALKTLADAIQAPWVSDHLCWTGIHGITTHDLLPVPYTETMLRHMVARVRQVQDILGRHIVIENPSTYLQFNASEMPEWEFLARLATEADCGLLLDVNNVYVSAFNHGYDATTYIRALPADRIVQMHLAGHQHHGTHIIDTHDSSVCDAVWDVYRHAITYTGPCTTLVEWDSHLPAWPQLVAEVDKARATAAQPEAA